jgi:hypothetical protein
MTDERKMTVSKALQGCCSFLDDHSDAELKERADTGLQLFNLLRKAPKDTLSKYKQNALPAVLDYLWDTQLHARATLDKRRDLRQLSEFRQSFANFEVARKRNPGKPYLQSERRAEAINEITEFESSVASIEERLIEVSARLEAMSSKRIDAYLTAFDFPPNDPLRPSIEKRAKNYQQSRQAKTKEFIDFAIRWWNDQREIDPGFSVSDHALKQFGDLCESREYKPNSSYLTGKGVYPPIAKYNRNHPEAQITTFPQLISVFLKSKASAVGATKKKKQQDRDYLDWRPLRSWLGTLASRARKFGS